MPPPLRALFAAAPLFLFPKGGLGARPRDAVAQLPGWGVPPAPQWSGYLNASAAEPGTMLHYWLARSERPDWAELPLVLWLNGGPGTSSILGMLQELGPLMLNASGGLMRNPHAWTRQANLLVLESPAGVGYSFCAAMLRGRGCSNTDVTTARAARAALQEFFRDFPEFFRHGLYLTGESYAGVYVPTLAEQLLDHAPEIPVKGLAVGNPCTDTASQRESMDLLWLAHKQGLVPDADFELLWRRCGVRRNRFLAQGHWRREAGRWTSEQQALRSAKPADPALAFRCKAATRRFLATTSWGLSQSWRGAYVNQLSLFSDSDFSEDDHMWAWMERPDVREALHVTVAPVNSWPGPPNGWEYRSSYSACNEAPNVTESMVDVYRRILPRLGRTLVYAGDADACVSYEGTRTAVERIGLAELPGGAYRPWFYDKTAASRELLAAKPVLYGPDMALRPAGPQFGGHVVDYAQNLSFATIHGAGHMVPQVRPQAAERLLRWLLGGEALVPPLPGDAELGALSEREFGELVDRWTEGAREVAAGSRPHPVSLVV